MIFNLSFRFVLLLFLTIAFSTQGLCAERLAEDQNELANRFDRLEEIALRIADSIESEEPDRAMQIRNTIMRAQQMSVADRFDSIVDILEGGNLSTAKQDQETLTEQLEELYQLVLADPRESQLEKERKAWEQLEKEIRRLIRSQRSLRSRVEREPTNQSSQEQSDLEADTEQLQSKDPLAGDGTEGQGKPSGDSQEGQGQESEPGQQGEQGHQGRQGQSGEATPSDSAKRIDQNLDKARDAMRQAQQNLDQQNVEDAKRKQLKALHELESAQREAEKKLRQLREEERQRMLAGLAERLRKMKISEEMLYASTSKLNDLRPEKSERYLVIETNKLADRQKLILISADRALKLIEEEGQSLVFAEALRQAASDMHQVEGRLRERRSDRLTQEIEQGVIEALDEMLKAVEETLDQMQKSQQQGNSGQSGQGDSSLVNQIAELRLLKATQMRIRRQTSFWEVAVEEGEATKEQMLVQIRELAIQQKRLAEAARHTAKKSR